MTSISRQSIEDQNLVARYLAGQLSESERESFEAYFVEHPEVLQELNRTAQFKSGLMDLQRSGAMEKLLQGKPWWQRPSTFSLAASIALIAIGAVIWQYSENRPSPTLATSVSALSNRFQSTLQVAASYRIERTRSSSYDATIPIPKEAAAIELRIKPETLATPPRYRVTFGTFKEGGETSSPIAIQNVTADDNGWVPIYLNASSLRPGIYELKISGEAEPSNTNEPSPFLIELTDGQ